MSPCQWKPGHPLDVGAYRCREEAWEESPRGLCIFHSEKNSKESVEEFTTQVLKKMEDMENRGEEYDFFGYIFPKGFSAFFKKEFKAPVNFADATFGDNVEFWHAAFGGNANFAGATFGDKAEFAGATFHDDANFAGATFGDNAEFWSAKFGDKAEFAGATFGDNAEFASAAFGDNAEFRNATFGDGAVFYGATFQGGVVFDGGEKEGEKEEKRGFRGEVDFSHVQFLKPKEVFFYNVNLSKAYFVGTPAIEFVRFAGVIWAKAGGRDAVVGDQGVEDAAIYRRLMRNFRNARDYRAAGDFYVGAMEIRRRELQREKWRGFYEFSHWAFYVAYRCFSLYGESYLVAATWLLASLLLSVFFFNASVPDGGVFIKMKEFPSGTFAVLLRFVAVPIFLSLFLLALKRRFPRLARRMEEWKAKISRSLKRPEKRR